MHRQSTRGSVSSEPPVERPYLRAEFFVDFDTRRMVVHRAVSAGSEGPTKSWQARFLPLADPAAEALMRLKARGDYTARDDYVFCSRLGRRLDPMHAKARPEDLEQSTWRSRPPRWRSNHRE